MPELVSLGLPGDEKAWTALGFTVDAHGRMPVGAVSCVVGMPPSWGSTNYAATPRNSVCRNCSARTQPPRDRSGS